MTSIAVATDAISSAIWWRYTAFVTVELTRPTASAIPPRAQATAVIAIVTTSMTGYPRGNEAAAPEPWLPVVTAGRKKTAGAVSASSVPRQPEQACGRLACGWGGSWSQCADHRERPSTVLSPGWRDRVVGADHVAGVYIRLDLAQPLEDLTGDVDRPREESGEQAADLAGSRRD
jgi:hypothetical protein